MHWLPPIDVESIIGDQTQIRVSHDTYGIQFHIETTADGPPRMLMDPAWQRKYESILPLSQALSKAMAQDPLEFRRVALAATELATTPALYGVEASQAMAFYLRMFSV